MSAAGRVPGATVAGMAARAEILAGLWRFTAIHPDWEEGEDWEPEVAWWAIQTERGLLLVDPLLDEPGELDELIAHCGGCAGVVRTCHWHQRSAAQVAERYATDLWARPAPAGLDAPRFDRVAESGKPLPGDVLALAVGRDDELVLWSGAQRALLAGDVLLRDEDGALGMCPDSGLTRDGGRAGLRPTLRELLDLPVEHVLVAHGPLVLGDGAEALARALRE